jgi:hypothetical protein
MRRQREPQPKEVLRRGGSIWHHQSASPTAIARPRTSQDESGCRARRMPPRVGASAGTAGHWLSLKGRSTRAVGAKRPRGAGRKGSVAEQRRRHWRPEHR